MSISAPSAASEAAPDARPVTQTPEFWLLIGYALALGVFGAFSALLFMGLIGQGGKWYKDSDPNWFGGHWWWVAVTVAAGLLVGLLRRWTRLPAQVPGLIDDLGSEHVEVRNVPGIVAVSAVSLMGGASLGPEKALGTMGGGAGTWISERRRLSQDDSKLNTLSGFAGAYGGMFSSTVIVTMLILEVARPGGRRLTKALLGTVVSSSVSFAIYFVVAGSVFLGAFKVPSYAFKDWQLLAGIGLGLFAAVVTTMVGLITKIAAMVFNRLKLPEIGSAALGGAIFGVIGVILPLTLFTGTSQLATVDKDAGSLAIGLLIAVLIAKMVTFGVCQASGFIGGPIFPMLFIGGTAGVAVHHIFSGIPLGLAFSCLLAAVPGSLVAAPFTMVLLAGFLTQIGALQTAPVLIAVVTGFLAVEGVKYFLALRQAAKVRSAAPA
jgi:H+/Cl- antiporter ClcA